MEEKLAIVITQLQQLIDINMLLLQEHNSEKAQLVDRVHNELNMFMTQEWEPVYAELFE